jgi:hypothetical protein
MRFEITHYIDLHVTDAVTPSTTIALPVNQSHFTDADFAKNLE